MKMVYEIKVKVNRPEPASKAVKTPTALTFVIRSDNEINAKVEALNGARRAQAAHPRKYKGCTFATMQCVEFH
jgi:hypothetical protein